MLHKGSAVPGCMARRVAGSFASRALHTMLCSKFVPVGTVVTPTILFGTTESFCCCSVMLCHVTSPPVVLALPLGLASPLDFAVYPHGKDHGAKMLKKVEILHEEDIGNTTNSILQRSIASKKALSNLKIRAIQEDYAT